MREIREGEFGEGDREALSQGVTWQEARGKADEMRLAGRQFTSYRRMAKAIGCSVSVLHDAIDKHGTVGLQQWASKQRWASRRNVAPEVAAVVIARTGQGREPDPANILHDCDVDVALAELLDQVGPDGRARINAMSPAEKRALAEVFYRDPDQEEQDSRYDELKRSRERSRGD